MTEDWSNDAENSALHHRNKLHSEIYSNKNPFFFFYYFTIFRFFSVFVIK